MCLAIPGRIVEIFGGDDLLRPARVDFGGVVKRVCLACVPEAKLGQYVLVHVGMAICIVDEKEARQVFEYLDQMGELAELKAESL
jgi:hydrogenase expression/formation protein HypC